MLLSGINILMFICVSVYLFLFFFQIVACTLTVLPPLRNSSAGTWAKDEPLR